MENTSRSCPTCETPLDDLGLCPRCLIAGAMAPTDMGKTKSAAPSLDELSASFPDLEVIELIGKGGMGAVYKCRQKSLDRFVALKILPQSLAADESFALRFQAEAKALAVLNHPNIVTIHDFGHQGDFYFLLMEYIDGLNLRHLILDRRLSPEEALAIIPPLCEALQFAHDRKIVHRDIKPENLLLDSTGRIKIADFGIATIIGKTNPTAEKVAGTPAYMAPEQRANAGSVDARADIYSLGVVLYEMLTGERPDPGLTPPSQKATLDVRIDEVVLRALNNQPDLRWQSATELNTRLQTILKPASLHERNAPHPDSLPHSTPRRARISCWLAFLTFILFFVFCILFLTIANSNTPSPMVRASRIETLESQIENAEFQNEANLKNNPELSPGRNKALKIIEEQITRDKKELADLKKQEATGKSTWEIIGPFVAVILPLVILIGAFSGIRLGSHHLSWLRGQSPEKPALASALVGTYLWLFFMSTCGIVLLCIMLLAEGPLRLWSKWHTIGAVLGLLSALSIFTWLVIATIARVNNEEKPFSKNRALLIVPLVAIVILTIVSKLSLTDRDLPAPETDPNIEFLEEKLTDLYKLRADLFSRGLGFNHPDNRSTYAQISAYEKQYQHLGAQTLHELKKRILRQLIAEEEARLAAIGAMGLGEQHPDTVKIQQRINDLESFLAEIPPQNKSRTDE